MEDPLASNSLEAYSELIALAILVIGFIGARLLSLGLGYVLAALDRRIARMTTRESSVLSPRLISFARAFVFWLVFILAVALALRLLGVGGISTILNGIIAFIPQAFVGFAIIVAGHLLGLLARNLLPQLDANIAADSLIPRLVHGVFVAVAVVMGLQHINVDITFITQLLLIVVAILGGGLTLAFALGARRHVANLLAHRELDRLAVGQRIRVEGEEGVIIEIHRTGVDIVTEEGIASIPAARFSEATVLKIGEDQHDG